MEEGCSASYCSVLQKMGCGPGASFIFRCPCDTRATFAEGLENLSFWIALSINTSESWETKGFLVP